MGTVHRLPPLDDRLPRGSDRDAPRTGLELPGWEESTTARDRFLAQLQADPGTPSGETRDAARERGVG